MNNLYKTYLNQKHKNKNRLMTAIEQYYEKSSEQVAKENMMYLCKNEELQQELINVMSVPRFVDEYTYLINVNKCTHDEETRENLCELYFEYN